MQGDVVRDFEIVLNEILAKHFPSDKRASSTEIAAVEERIGAKLPKDMVDFYQTFDGARLFSANDPAYRILALAELQPVSRLILGEDDTEGTERWIAFCDVRDGNYVAADLTSPAHFRCDILDCFHETFPDRNYIKVIADSFQQFLDQALLSSGQLYWLADG